MELTREFTWIGWLQRQQQRCLDSRRDDGAVDGAVETFPCGPYDTGMMDIPARYGEERRCGDQAQRFSYCSWVHISLWNNGE